MAPYTTKDKVRYTGHNWTEVNLPNNQTDFFITCGDAIINAQAKKTFSGNAVTATIIEHGSTLIAGILARAYDPTLETISDAGFSADAHAYLLEIILGQLKDERVLVWLDNL